MSFQRKTRISTSQTFGIIALFSIIGSMGCDGISTKGTSSSCETGTAQIIVYEGAMKRVCGCTEGSGTFSQPSSLTCTVPFNTAVYFYFTAISSSHQVSVTNIGSTSAVDANSSVKTSAIVMNQIGTFTFQDIFNGIGGSFVVTP